MSELTSLGEPSPVWPTQLPLFSESVFAAGGAVPLTRAALHDAVYDGRRSDVRVYLGLAMATPGPVLELGAGAGRLLLPLLARGIDAVGLECDPDALQVGWGRLGALGGGGFRRRLIEGDMRAFELGRRFSLIYVACNTLSLLIEQSDLDATLDCVRRHLRPDGALVFDISRVEGQVWQHPPHVWRGDSEALWVLGVAATSVESGRYDPDTRLTNVTREFLLADGRSARVSTLSRQRSVEQVLECLEARGLSALPPIDERGQPVSEQSRLVFVRSELRE